MKDVLNDELEDILEEVKISLRGAYHRGYVHGEKGQALINSKLSNPNLILGEFIKFINNFADFSSR